MLSCIYLALQVLYSKFGFMYTEVELQGEDYILIREDDIIGTLPKAGKDSACFDALALG